MLLPKQLARFLHASLENGNYKLTFAETAQGIFEIKRATGAHIGEIKRCWPRAQKHLRRLGTCAMLVTDEYFINFPRKEPRAANTIALSLAGEGKAAAGFRLLTAKGAVNDPMAIAFYAMRTRNVRGGVSAIEDRVAIEFKRGKLAKRIGRRIIDDVNAPVLPDHGQEFGELME